MVFHGGIARDATAAGKRAMKRGAGEGQAHGSDDALKSGSAGEPDAVFRSAHRLPGSRVPSRGADPLVEGGAELVSAGEMLGIADRLATVSSDAGLASSTGRRRLMHACWVMSCGVRGAGRVAKWSGAATTILRKSSPMRTPILSPSTPFSHFGSDAGRGWSGGAGRAWPGRRFGSSGTKEAGRAWRSRRGLQG